MLNTFLDESGTSGAPHENIGVVAGVAVPQSMQEDVLKMVARLFDECVPAHFRDGFVYHTTDLLNSKKFRDRWPLASRLQLIHCMMRIPKYFRLPIIWAAVRKEHVVDYVGQPPPGRREISQIEARHLVCFINCVGTINRYLEEKNETGHLVVEQCESMQNRLHASFEAMRSQPPAYFDTSAGSLKWSNDRIIAPAVFLPPEDPLLQVADACAFGVRSILARTTHCKAYARAISDESALDLIVSDVSGGLIESSLKEGMSMPAAVMNEATAEVASEAAGKYYVVVFRCESRVVTEPAGKWFTLPAFDVGGGLLTFNLTSEYRPSASGVPAHTHLLLQTMVYAASMGKAHLAAQMAASCVTSYLAFAHNAYIEAPLRWFSFEVGKSKDWRRLAQIEYESAIPPHITIWKRQYQHELSCKLINEVIANFHNPSGNKFLRSLGLYERALANWDSLHGLFAAQYLFMTIEPLWERAVPQLVSKRGKSKEAIVQEFYEEEIGDLVASVPSCASEQEAKAIRKLIDRVESKATVDAKQRRLKNAALQEVVFENADATFTALNRAMNGLEHGYEEFQITMQKVLPLLDETALCIRKWLCKEITKDAALLALLDGERRFPVALGKASQMVDAEFRSETIEDPVVGYSPFRLMPIPNAKGQWYLDVASTVKQSVELRVLASKVRFVEPTHAAEQRAMAAVLEYNWGIKPPP
jgi:hypothetical protein